MPVLMSSRGTRLSHRRTSRTQRSWFEEASRAMTRSNYRRFATGRKNSLDTFTFDMGFRSQKSFGCPWQ